MALVKFRDPAHAQAFHKEYDRRLFSSMEVGREWTGPGSATSRANSLPPRARARAWNGGG